MLYCIHCYLIKKSFNQKTSYKIMIIVECSKYTLIEMLNRVTVLIIR